jgi:beta-mannanase
MNGNWYPWSLNSTPNEYIMAWHHIHNIFSNKSLDSTRLQWVWSVNYADFGNYTAENYWVGDNYVDWLGIDGYNFGGGSHGDAWVWPNEIFDKMIARVMNLSSTKPLSINEYGTTSIRARNVSNIQLKTEWLNRFCDYISNSQMKMASYFNIDYETDWAIFGGIHGDIVWNSFNAYSAYKNCLQSDEWIQPNSTNERIITDEQFAGKL